MRILHVIPFFTPSMGGSARVAYQMARHLGERGHEVTVVASDYGAREASFAPGPFQVVLLPAAVARWGFYVTPGLPRWAARNLGRFDIVHLHELRTFQNAVVARQAVRRRIPYLLSAHGTLPIIVQRQAAKRAYDLAAGRFVLGSASRILAVSPAEEEQFRAYGIPPARTALVYNGLDLAEFADLPARGAFRQRWGVPPHSKLILFLGRVHPIKGIDHLIAAFAGLKDALPEALLVIAGPDAGDLARLRRLVQTLGLDQSVQFTGGLYGADRLAAMVDADLFAAPSQYEIFGLAPCEALMCGAPVLVTAGSAAGELLQQAGAAWLAPYGEPDALGQALLAALSAPDRSQQMVQAGQSFVRSHLGWPGIVQRLEEVYAGQLAAA